MEGCTLTNVTSCVLECCLHPTTPPVHKQTHTHKNTHSHGPGCQSYTNSHPLAAGFQDNHGNQSLTPGETSSRSERLHSISTSQYNTHKRTHMHIFHRLIHTHWQARIYTHWHGHIQCNPLALTASQSLQPSLPASTRVSGSLLERPHTTSSHPRSTTAHTQSASETLITPQSLWLHTLSKQVDTLFSAKKKDCLSSSPTSVHQVFHSIATKLLYHLNATQ